MQEFKIQYYQGINRMNPELERKIKLNQTSLSENPAFPNIGGESNYIELISYKRFLDVCERVKRYTGIENISSQNNLMMLQEILSQSVYELFEIEKNHKEQLEKLAVEIVTKEMEIPKGVFDFDVKLVQIGEISGEGFQKSSKEPNQQEIENQFTNDYISAQENFQLEKDKRRFINCLVQGSSKKGHYMFELIRDKLTSINSKLPDLYGKVMSINDLMYWLLSDAQINQMASNTSSITGKEEIESESETPKLKIEGLFHPVLVHEIIKAVMEVFGTHGLPDDPTSQKMILESTDTLSNEIWDLRLGVVIWEKYLRSLPLEILEEGNRNIQHYLFAKFCQLNKDEFFNLSSNILSEKKDGQKIIQDMINEIKSDLKKQEYQKTLNEDDDEYFSFDDL